MMVCRPFIEGMMCDFDLIVRARPFLEYSKLNKSENFLKKIKRYYRVQWFTNQTATWNTRFRPEFTEVLTKFGYGFAFNMLPESKLFTDK
jgi:hypothetical protein